MLFYILQVQWEFEERKDKFTPYPEEMNGKLEMAYSKKLRKIKWQELEDDSQKEITLDLKNMTETDGSTSIRIRRRDLSNGKYLITYGFEW